MVAWIGPAISAGANILGGIFGAHSARKAATTAFNRQRELQREAWRREDRAIQTRVADAKAAGIHPLAALGHPGQSSVASAVPMAASGHMGQAISAAGANLGEGISRMFDERAQLSNDLLRSQIRNVDASTARMLTDATSRTLLSGATSAAQGGPGSKRQDRIIVSERTGKGIRGGLTMDIGSGTPSSVVEDEYGDIVGGVHGIVRYLTDDWGAFRNEVAPYLNTPRRKPKRKYRTKSTF